MRLTALDLATTDISQLEICRERRVFVGFLVSLTVLLPKHYIIIADANTYPIRAVAAGLARIIIQVSQLNGKSRIFLLPLTLAAEKFSQSFIDASSISQTICIISRPYVSGNVTNLFYQSSSAPACIGA